MLKLLLSGVAAERGVAVLIDAVAEVLTGHADAGYLQALKASVVDKSPLLHGYPWQYACTGTDRRLGATDIPTGLGATLLSANQQRDI